MVCYLCAESLCLEADWKLADFALGYFGKVLLTSLLQSWVSRKALRPFWITVLKVNYIQSLVFGESEEKLRKRIIREMGKDDEKGCKLFVFHRKVFSASFPAVQALHIIIHCVVAGGLFSPMQISRSSRNWLRSCTYILKVEVLYFYGQYLNKKLSLRLNKNG